jgi:hypothetical protein
VGRKEARYCSSEREAGKKILNVTGKRIRAAWNGEMGKFVFRLIC